MSEAFDLYNLFFLALAVVIFLRLRSVLGKRTGNERRRQDPYSTNDAPDSATNNRDRDDKIVTLPGRQRGPAQGGEDAVDVVEAPNWGKFAPAGSPLEKALISIFEADRNFDPGRFLEGARMAYEMIVTAFAQGDRKALKPLLGSDVYEGFASAIEEREKNKHTIQSSFVGIEKADIIEASLAAKKANITVKFVSELISATFDAGGKLIDGDPKAVREVTDIWTFMRDVSSRDPNWKLVATESAQ